eukprot:gb/GECH01012625.1/.p1 GENE.gb/GECH01012625.1/~~gb/GECH01012625.1/.p1  ORF type:complete len:145 (+),score=42.34 gb/GECH01012625.1/:1-435(+)
MSASSAIRVLPTYHHLLKVANLVPNRIKKQKLIEEIKNGFRKNSQIQDSQQITKLLDEALSRKKFEAMSIPRYTLKKVEQNEIFSGQFLFRNGKLEKVEHIKRSKKAMSNWREGNLDPDSVARHNALLRRQHFMEGPLANKFRR